MTTRQIIRACGLWAWTVLMTGMTVVLGGVPLKALRRDLGRTGYWFLCVVTAAILFASGMKVFAAIYFSLVVLIGLFAEWEELGMALMPSAFFSLVTTILVASAGVALWISRTGASWKDLILARLDESLKPAMELTPSFQFNSSDIMMQLPSLFIVMWLVTLYLSVLLEKRAVIQSRHAKYEVSFREELGRINIPSFVIWAFIFALLGAFGDFGKLGLEAGCVNVLNVCLMLFFFQGLAVVTRAFAVFRIGFFWQALLMIILVSQLWILSLLGLVDHWVDFRSRLSKGKGREQMNNELQ
jgi:hypothetical protein